MDRRIEFNHITTRTDGEISAAVRQWRIRTVRSQIVRDMVAGWRGQSGQYNSRSLIGQLSEEIVALAESKAMPPKNQRGMSVGQQVQRSMAFADLSRRQRIATNSTG